MELKKKKSDNIIKFIEGFVYIILIIITIIANSYGNIYIKLIPLLFILGFIGKVLYSRPIVTSLFGGVFSIVTLYVNGTYSVNEILITSLGNFILILLGEIFGVCVIATCKTINSKIRKKQSFKYIIITILFFLLSIFLTCYTNGDIFSYIRAEKKLQNYLNENYNNETFEITGYRYIPYVNSGYSFKVKNVNNQNLYKFIVYTKNDTKIYDEYINSLITINNNNMKKYISKNLNNEFDVFFSNEYIKLDKARVIIKCITTDEDYENNCSDMLVKIISKLSLYEKYDDIYEIEFIVRDIDGNTINTIFIDTYEYKKFESSGMENEYIFNLLKIEFFDF